MARVILSIKEFVTTFKVGDQFWHMESSFCLPVGIEGPLVILKFLEDEVGPQVICEGNLCLDILSEDDLDRGLYIDDLTNSWHGVFLTEQDALEYLAERKHAYETDPKLIFEVSATMSVVEELLR